MKLATHQSLGRKLTLVIMLTSAVTVVVAALAFVGMDALRFRANLSDEIATLAQIVGNNCAAALDFNDPAAAADTLAGLRARPSIRNAYVYGRNGHVFAMYQRDGETIGSAGSFVPAAGREFQGNQLRVVQPISIQGEQVGSIAVTCDLHELADHLKRILAISVLVLGLALLASYPLSVRLQRVVSGPVLQLAQVARSVALEKNYAVRAAKVSDDELGQLVDGFNDMLVQIQQRDAALRSAHNELEGRVTARTAELDATNAILKRQQSELRVLFDLMPAMIWFKDTNNVILRVNQRVADAAGKSIGEIEGRPSVEIYPQDAARLYADDSKVMRSGAPVMGIVETLQGAGGVTLWVQTDKVPVCDKDGTVIGIVVMAQDITARVRAEEKLRLLSSAVEQSKESVMITDAILDVPGPRIVFVNPAFTQMTGYTAEEVIGKTPRLLQGPRTDKLVLNRLRKNLKDGETFAGEAINYRKDGTEFMLAWHIAPILNPAGIVMHYVATQHDITERKRFEAQLFQSQKMETVGKLAGGVAHEFNSIMTAILGQSELLLADIAPGNPLSSHALEIHKAAERAAALTRQLLAYGRKQTLQPAAVDLNAILAGMEGALRHLMGRGADVRIVPATGLNAVLADAGQIEQVIVNMAMNADDAMPNGGKLTIETANVILDQAYVSQYPEMAAGAYVMLAISDTGAGMTEAVKARIFEPFFTTKGVGQGAGLGLSTCYGILKQSGGHISVYSEPGRGTTFKIYLPQAGPLTTPTPRRFSPTGLPRGTETILLVEDDPALREMAGSLLRRLGYTVLAAANGIDALNLQQQADAGHVDLLFTDVVMPHMSGKELAERVQVLYPHTRILFTSAYTENAIVHQGLLTKGVALLQKPFTPSALAVNVRAVLDG